MMRFLMTGVVACVMIAAAEPAQTTTLIVSVGEAGSGTFIADAEVTLPAMSKSMRTRWDGEARFGSLSRGRYRIQVRALGFAPGDIEADVAGDSMGVHFELERVNVALDTVRVVDKRPSIRMAEFESRRRMGIGRFLTDSVLRDDRSQSLQWVLATRFPGIKVVENSIESMQPSGLAADMSCPVLIYIDGFQVTDVHRQPMKPPKQAGGRGGLVATGVDQAPRALFPLDNIRPDSLAGAEMYSRTTAPVQYKPLGNYCKVILLWTRR